MTCLQVKEIRIGNTTIYKMYDKFYVVVKGKGCPSCCFKRKGVNCLMYSQPRCCFDLIGENRVNKKCFAEIKGGI